MKMNRCGRCGKEYETYLIFIRNDIVSYSSHLTLEDEIKEKYNGHVCEKCRSELKEKFLGDEVREDE